MAHAIQMPSLGYAKYNLPEREWNVLDVRGFGIAQVLPDIPLEPGISAVAPYACFHRFSVEEGETVAPGQVVAEVLVDNVVMNIYSVTHGIVSGLVDYEEHDIVVPGDILLNVMARSDRSSRQKGLVPKPSTYQRFLRFGR